MAWLYVGKLARQVTLERLKAYLHKKGKPRTECEELNTLGANKAFKIGFSMTHLAKAEESAFWPQGVMDRMFRFPRRYPNRQGVNLDY